jgi:hypothetical protein
MSMRRKLGIVVVVVVTMALAACSPQSTPRGTVTGSFVAIGGLTPYPAHSPDK